MNLIVGCFTNLIGLALHMELFHWNPAKLLNEFSKFENSFLSVCSQIKRIRKFNCFIPGKESLTKNLGEPV